MGWVYDNKQKKVLIQRKHSLEGDGENAEGVQELAETYIRKGHTRQSAYAKARKELGKNYKKKYKKNYQGGGMSPK